MEKIIKELHGHSGSKVYLKEIDGVYCVEKVGNTSRNVERMSALHKLGYHVPKIYLTIDDSLLMEYIHGLDMENYLIHNNINQLYNFISETIDDFSNDSEMKDYTDTYFNKLAWLDKTKNMPFTKYDLIAKLPKVLPKSTYHGDFTLENILHTNTGFVMIDPVTIEYDSYVFDLAKLRQDIECKWFLRNSESKLDTKLEILNSKLKKTYSQDIDDSLLILMLLRVLKHCEIGDDNYNFLMKEIHRLWK
jgi:tRNA A-37 threonylcarbamoyl transferase component Bud32